MKAPVWLVGLLVVVGCDADLQRMQVQRRANPSADDPARIALMEQGSPGQGTVAHDRPVERPDLLEGCAGAAYVAHIPGPASTTVGKAMFDRFCAACHGAAGDGVSVVAQAMEKTKPRSLLDPPVRDYPPGRIYRTVMLGYRMMPRYEADLEVGERWGVVAYVKMLQAQAPSPAPGSGRGADTGPGPVCPGGQP